VSSRPPSGIKNQLLLNKLVQAVQTTRIFKWLEGSTGASDHEGKNVEQEAGGDMAMWEMIEDEMSPRKS
jgi:hypothetical protein